MTVVGGLIGMSTLVGPDGNAVVPNRPTPAHSAAPRPTTSTTPGPSTTASPTPSSSAIGTIPDSAFLQPPENNGTALHKSTSQPDAEPLPPLCQAEFASRALMTQRRVMNVLFWRERQSEPGWVPDGEFKQTITLYQPGGAAQFFTEIRSALAGCAAEPYLGGLARYAVIAERTFGDDSVAVSVMRYYPTSSAGEPNNGPPPEYEQFITVVRIGDAVTVQFSSGWEGFPVDWAVVETMTERAVRRITDWRGP